MPRKFILIPDRPPSRRSFSPFEICPFMLDGSLIYDRGLQTLVDLNFKTNKTYKEMERYIDFGLPSGTLWADRNFGADSAKGSGQFLAWDNIPENTATPQQWKELLDNSEVKKCNEAFIEYKGRRVLTRCEWKLISKINGASIVLNSAGWKQPDDPNLHNEGEVAIYWTTEPNTVAYTQANTAKVVYSHLEVPIGWEGVQLGTARPYGWLRTVRRTQKKA